MTTRPTGTVTFLFTDIEGSTRLLHELGDRYRETLEDHRRLLREAFARNGGHEVDTQGDAFFVAFARAQDAVRAAAEAQRALAGHDWPDERELRVRMGIHTCEATATDQGYVGIGVHRGARIASAGHGGQVLLSQTTRELLEEQGDESLGSRDLGEHRLKDLTRPTRLYQLTGEGLREEFPPLKTLENRPTNLPAQPTPIVGRVRELGEVCTLVRNGEGRIVTLTGPGGTGKTRLVLQAAADLLEDFRDGVFFVPLAAVADPELVLPTVAQTLGVTSTALQTLEGYVADKELLLVLDNLEQILDAGPQISQLCSQGAGLKMLVTSREPLRLSGERVYPVPPLELDHDAMELFAERARAAKPDFELDGNTEAVRELCARLDGLPLALELAAARIALLTPEAMLERLGDRLKLLTGGARDLPERQRTLRDTLEWSYELLSDEERVLFARLGVFAGGFTLEAAEAVCDAELDVLASLVAKSLVQHADGRYSLLETIRAYALDRLGEAQIAERHAAFFLALAEQGWHEKFEREAYWLARLEMELDNLRAALDWFSEHDPERELQLAAYLGWMWALLSHLREGRNRLEAALGRSTGDLRARALALTWAGQCAAYLGDAAVGIQQGKESLAIWRSLGDRYEEGKTLGLLAWTQFLGGDLESARISAEESLAVQRSLEDTFQITNAISTLAQILVAEGDVEHAEPLAHEALATALELGSTRIEHFSRHYLGDCALIRGDPGGAEPHYRRSLETAVELGDRVEIYTELQGLAMCLAGLGRVETALHLEGAADAGFESLGVDLSGITFWVELVERYLGDARRSPEGAVAWARGRELDLEQAVELALAAG